MIPPDLRSLTSNGYPGPSISPPPTWISSVGPKPPSQTSFLTTAVGGPDRPPSKRMIEQMRAEDRQRQEAARAGAGPSSAVNKQDEGYWAYMQRQVQERTEKLNVMGDSMERLEESSAGWADDVSKYVRNQKKKAVMGSTYRRQRGAIRDANWVPVIGSKFGL